MPIYEHPITPTGGAWDAYFFYVYGRVLSYTISIFVTHGYWVCTGRLYRFIIYSYGGVGCGGGTGGGSIMPPHLPLALPLPVPLGLPLPLL